MKHDRASGSTPALGSERSLPSRGRRHVLPLAAAIGLASVLHFAGGEWLGRFYSRLLLDVGIAIVAAVSLNIVNGLTGQFSIGHAGFVAVGGYASGAFTYYASFLIWGDALKHGDLFGGGSMLFLGGCVLGGIVAAIAGYIVGLPTLRLRGDYLAIVTLGFGEILRVVLQQTNPVLFSLEEIQQASLRQLLPPPLGGSLGFSDIPKYTNLFWVYLCVGVTVVAAYRLKVSTAGRSMLAVREDEIAAQSTGVNITRTKVRAFVLSAFVGGVAGSLYAHESGVIIRPLDAGFQRSFEFVIMVVLGGRGSISGVTLAAAVLTLLPEVLRDFEQYRMIVYALVLIAMMILRPQGLLGTHEIWEYLPGRRKKGA